MQSNDNTGNMLVDALKDMVCLVLSELGDSSPTYQNAIRVIAEAEGRANV